MRIGNHIISCSQVPFIVAEMSGNHNQSIDRALAIVDAAAQANVHAVKIQTYTADTMTLDVDGGAFKIHDDKSLWNGRSLFSLYNEAHTPWEWHREIKERCIASNVEMFSTPFDESAVAFLESLSVPAYKVASFEIVDLPLIRAIAETKKPIILSTGMATLAEIDEAVNTARKAGCDELMLLKCTSTYPADPGDSNVATLGHMRALFGCEVGLSDHTLGLGAAIAAVAHGATLIEKHFTLRRADGGVDSAFSLEPDEMKQLVAETDRAWRSLGGVVYGPGDHEKPSLQFRRSLFVAEDMEAGDVFTPKNLRRIRPGSGLPPKYYDIILGRPVRRRVRKGTPVTWDLL